jgi:hypothetical protein
LSALVSRLDVLLQVRGRQFNAELVDLFIGRWHLPNDVASVASRFMEKEPKAQIRLLKRTCRLLKGLLANLHDRDLPDRLARALISEALANAEMLLTAQVGPRRPRDNQVLIDAKRQFRHAGLRFPRIPVDLVPRLKMISQWLFATRNDLDPVGLYELIVRTGPHGYEFSPPEAAIRRVDDYVAVCHSGYGRNNYAITFHCVSGQAALLLQTAWGGPDLDNDEQAQRLRVQLQRAKELMAWLADLSEQRNLGGTLVVVESDTSLARASMGEERNCASWTLRTDDVDDDTAEWWKSFVRLGNGGLDSALAWLAGI